MHFLFVCPSGNGTRKLRTGFKTIPFWSKNIKYISVFLTRGIDLQQPKRLPLQHDFSFPISSWCNYESSVLCLMLRFLSWLLFLFLKVTFVSFKLFCFVTGNFFSLNFTAGTLSCLSTFSAPSCFVAESSFLDKKIKKIRKSNKSRTFCGVVVITLAFQTGRPGFNPWLDSRS